MIPVLQKRKLRLREVKDLPTVMHPGREARHMTLLW